MLGCRHHGWATCQLLRHSRLCPVQHGHANQGLLVPHPVCSRFHGLRRFAAPFGPAMAPQVSCLGLSTQTARTGCPDQDSLHAAVAWSSMLNYSWLHHARRLIMELSHVDTDASREEVRGLCSNAAGSTCMLIRAACHAASVQIKKAQIDALLEAVCHLLKVKGLLQHPRLAEMWAQLSMDPAVLWPLTISESQPLSGELPSDPLSQRLQSPPSQQLQSPPSQPSLHQRLQSPPLHPSLPPPSLTQEPEAVSQSQSQHAWLDSQGDGSAPAPMLPPDFILRDVGGACNFRIQCVGAGPVLACATNAHTWRWDPFSSFLNMTGSESIAGQPILSRTIAALGKSGTATRHTQACPETQRQTYDQFCSSNHLPFLLSHISSLIASRYRCSPILT